MTLLDAAEKVINEVRYPLGVKELYERISKRHLWSTTAKKPLTILHAQLATHIKNGGKRFVRCAPGMYGVPGMIKLTIPIKQSVKAKTDRRVVKNAPGYVYIMTNPSFKRSWIKIGYTTGGIDAVSRRCRELSNSSVPYPFEVYAVLKSFNAFDTEQRIHLALEAGGNSRLSPNREFFDLSLERALKAFKAIVSDEAIVFYKDGNPVNVQGGITKGQVRKVKVRGAIKVYYTRRGANAQGEFKDGALTVLKGSVCATKRETPITARNPGFQKLRTQLEREGVIKRGVFVQNYTFQSASAAAAVVAGTPTGSGLFEWKTSDRKPLKLSIG